MRTGPTLISLPLLIGALALTACGSSDKKKTSSSGATGSKPAALSITAADSGKKTTLTVPASTSGGIVTVTLKNTGKRPHEAQLVRLGGGKTIADVKKALNSPKIPTWAHLYGGVPATPPGKTEEATVSLPAGNYVVVDNPNGPGGGGAQPGLKAFKVSAGAGGSLPSTATTITAASPAKDKYKWDIQGTLKPGGNRITFVSKGGPDALHFIAAVRLKGNPTNAQVQKALKSNGNGKPPPFLDTTSFTSTSIVDSGKSEVTSLALRKPGKYLLFCPLTDKDGGKQHDQEGLVTRVNVK